MLLNEDGRSKADRGKIVCEKSFNWASLLTLVAYCSPRKLAGMIGAFPHRSRKLQKAGTIDRSPWSKSSRMLYWPFICSSNDHLKSNVWLEIKYYLSSLCWRLLNNSLNLPRSSYQTDILSCRDVYHDHLMEWVCLKFCTVLRLLESFSQTWSFLRTTIGGNDRSFPI